MAGPLKTSGQLRRHTGRSTHEQASRLHSLNDRDRRLQPFRCGSGAIPAAQQAQQRAKRDLDDANRKLKETFRQASAETKQDLDKAREQLRQAARKTNQDLKKARDEVRDSRQQ